MKREQITIRLPKDLKDKIQRQADKMGISFNARLIMIIQKGFKSE